MWQSLLVVSPAYICTQGQCDGSPGFLPPLGPQALVDLCNRKTRQVRDCTRPICLSSRQGVVPPLVVCGVDLIDVVVSAVQLEQVATARAGQPDGLLQEATGELEPGASQKETPLVGGSSQQSPCATCVSVSFLFCINCQITLSRTPLHTRTHTHTHTHIYIHKHIIYIHI